MGIYPNEEYKFIAPDTLQRTYSTPGYVKTETFKLVRTDELRTDCYCCSCGDDGGVDPYCRNHGWAGSRPCEVHNMPGVVDDDNEMPESVQKKRANS
jgi:hypothetical protein